MLLSFSRRNWSFTIKSWEVNEWRVCFPFRSDPSFSCNRRGLVIFWWASKQVPTRARLFQVRSRLTREACSRWQDPRPSCRRRSRCQSRERRTKKKILRFQFLNLGFNIKEENEHVCHRVKRYTTSAMYIGGLSSLLMQCVTRIWTSLTRLNLILVMFWAWANFYYCPSCLKIWRLLQKWSKLVRK